MNNFKFIWNYIRRYKWLYIAGIATLFVVDFASLYIPKYTGIITDGLSQHIFTMNDVIYNLFKIFVVGFLMTLGRVGWRFFFIGTSRKVERDLRDKMFSHLTLMSADYYHKHPSGDLMSRFTNDLGCIRQAIGPAIISLFDGTVMTVMVLLQMIFYVDYRLTILTMLPMILIAIGTLWFGKKMHGLYEQRQEAISSLTDYSRESFLGIRVVQSFVRERYRIWKFAKENINTRDKTLKANYMLALMMPLLDLVIEISILITLIFGGYLTIHGTISVGRFIAYNQYIIMLIWPMMACGDAINSFSQGSASIGRVREILEHEPDITDTKDVLDSLPDNNNILFNNLSFQYPDRSDAGVRSISFEANKGEMVAITGKTGCGKTTIVELLLHVYQVKNDSIYIGGKDINSIAIKTLRDMIAYVPQDDFLFSDTVRNNIAFGAGNVTMEDVINAANLACVHDNICAFPEGYDTKIGERGVTLSGGQKQRVCIARALLKKSKILILDDAMSAVDTDTERNLITNISEEVADRITIIIAHRITTISKANKILYMEDGEIIENGTHEELLAQNGAYKALYEKQQLEDECKDFLA